MEKKVKFYLRNDKILENAILHLKSMPLNALKPSVVSIYPEGRSLGQNAMFHALCGDLASSELAFAGKRRKLEEWKVILVSGHAAATKRDDGEIICGIEGELISIRESTAQMGVKRMTSLLEYAIAYATGQGIKLRDLTYDNYFGEMK